MSADSRHTVPPGEIDAIDAEERAAIEDGGGDRFTDETPEAKWDPSGRAAAEKAIAPDTAGHQGGTTATADGLGSSAGTNGAGATPAPGPAERSTASPDTPETQPAPTPGPTRPPSGVLTVVPAPANAPVIDHAIALGRSGLRVTFVHAPLFGLSRTPTAAFPAATACTCRTRKRPNCEDTGKHPILDAWQRVATADEVKLRAQYALLRAAPPNLGIVLGEQPAGQYLIAIDIDDEVRRQELVAEYGPLPETASCESARGPKLFYRLPLDTPLDRIKNITGLGEKSGIDVKVRSGQVVVPPSVHRSGRPYAWSATGPIAELSAGWVLAILGPPEKPKAKSTYTPGSIRDGAHDQKRARAYLEKAVTGEAALLARTTEGGRNNGLYRSLCRLLPLAHGPEMPPGSHDFVVRELSAAVKVAGLGEQEIAKTVASAEKRVGAQVRDMPPPKEPPKSPGRRPANGSAQSPDEEPPVGDGEEGDFDDPLARLDDITDVDSAAQALDDDPWLLGIFDAGEGARARATERLARYVGKPAIERAFRRAQQRRAQAQEAGKSGENHGPYRIEGGRFIVERDDKPPYAVSNFTARVVEDELIDDGAAQKRVIWLAGTTCDGHQLPRAAVDAIRFGSSHAAWVMEIWGASALVEADAHQHIRPAILHHSEGFMKTHAFAHTGWRDIEVRANDGSVRRRPIYLSAGGVIGADDIVVRLDDGLQRYALPHESASTELVIEAVNESLRMLEAVPDRVGIPLVASAFRAPLCHWLPFDSILWLHGPTGSLKSSLVALVIGYFGLGWDRTKLTATFLDTPASIETKLYRAKDVVAVIDDYAPDNADVRDAVIRLAQQITRSVGNSQSRGRMRSNMDEMPSRPPRALVIVTAEDQMIGGESIAARTLPVGIRRADVKMETLTQLQQRRHLAPVAMRAYIEWLAEFADAIVPKLRERFVEFRAAYQGAHLRAPEVAANLELGWHAFLTFAVHVGAIDEERANELRLRGRAALRECLDAQAMTISAEEPVDLFLGTLRELVHTKQVRFAENGENIDTQVATYTKAPEEAVMMISRPEQKAIGWIGPKETLHLLPNVTYAEVQRALKQVGRSLRVSDRELWRRLEARGYVTPYEAGRLTVRRVHAGRERSVVELLGNMTAPAPKEG